MTERTSPTTDTTAPARRDRPDAGYVVLANPSAGSADRAALGEVLTVLGERAPARVVRLGNDPIATVLADLGGATPVVMGGDGTIHRVVDAVVGSELADLPIGIVPAGTGNDLARSLDLPLDPVAAAQVVVDGDPRPMPVLASTGGGTSVVNAAHLGVGPEAVAAASRLKSRLGRVAYPLGAAAAGLRFPGVRVRVDVDGRRLGGVRHLAVMVLVGDGFGGGLRPTGDTGSTPVVVTVPPAERTRRLGLAVAAARSTLHRRPDVDVASGARVEIRADDGDPIRAVVDGEVLDLPSPIVLEHRPAAWTVLAPPAGRGEGIRPG